MLDLPNGGPRHLQWGARLLGIARSALVAALAGCTAAGPGLAAAGLPSLRAGTTPPAGSTASAYRFLDLMMDRYARGATTRLVQSFDGGGVGNFTDAVTYDDALAVDAYLARGSAGDLERAAVIGNAFAYVQAHDPARDGRVRAAYAPRPLLRPSDAIATDRTSDVGNMAWVGQALVQLYAASHRAAYLSAAEAIAGWIAANAYDARGAGGYTGGDLPGGAKIRWKSTEHNIDAWALFTLLAGQTHESSWAVKAAWARRFVAAMWDAKDGRFYAGTGDDGVTPNAGFKPEDVNTWSYLAFRNPAWAAAPDWDAAQLAVDAGGFRGVSFCSGDRSGVWFEGTAHLADALALRNGPGDLARARSYLSDVAFAQTAAPNADGLGIVAASKNRLSDCDGDFYFASLHVGATAWYLLAAAQADPFTYPIRR